MDFVADSLAPIGVIGDAKRVPVTVAGSDVLRDEGAFTRIFKADCGKCSPSGARTKHRPKKHSLSDDSPEPRDWNNIGNGWAGGAWLCFLRPAYSPSFVSNFALTEPSKVCTHTSRL